MNDRLDPAELLDDTITKVLEHGSNARFVLASDMQSPSAMNVVRDVRMLAESTPMRAGFLSELEAQLMTMAGESAVSSTHDEGELISGQTASNIWNKLKSGWEKRWGLRDGRQMDVGHSQRHAAPGQGLAGLLVILVLAASAGLLWMRQPTTSDKSKSTPTATSFVTPTVATTPTIMPAQMGMEIPLGAGATIKMINQVQASTVGVKSGFCGRQMTWVLQIDNRSNEVFTATINKTSVAMTDGSGKNYPVLACGSFSGSFVEPMTLTAGETLKGFIAFQADDMPAGIEYFDLALTVSGVPVTFRYELPTNATVVPAQATSTRVAGSLPLSLVRDGEGFRLDVYEGTARFGDTFGNSAWVDSSRLLIEWGSGPSDLTNVTGEYTYSTYIVDTNLNLLVPLPESWGNVRMYPSPDGKRAIMVLDNSSLRVALYDFQTGAIEIVAGDTSQWAGPEIGIGDFRPGTEVFVSIAPLWAGNDEFALTLTQSSEVGPSATHDRALLVDVTQKSVRVLAQQGQVVATFADGGVLVRSGKIDGEMQVFRPGQEAISVASPTGPWTFDWSVSPDGRRVAWLEMTPPPGDWSEQVPGICCGDPPPTVKDIVVWDYYASSANAEVVRHLDVANYAWTKPDFWIEASPVRWSKDGTSIFYASHPTVASTTLYRLSLDGQSSPIAEMDRIVGFDVVAEAIDGSFYLKVNGIECSQCVQLMRAYPGGKMEVVVLNSSTPMIWSVDDSGHLKMLQDGGVAITDLIANQSYQVNFPGAELTDDQIGNTRIDGLVQVSPDARWAAYAGTQSDQYQLEADGRPDRGRTVYIVKVK